MKIKTYWDESNKYIFKLSFVFFWQHELLFILSAHRTQSCTVYIYMYINTYLYIFTLSVYVSLLAGDQVRMNVCLLVRLFLLVIFFFSFCAQYTICQTSGCTIYICRQRTYTVSWRKKGFWRTRKRKIVR
jgi:hypothetical protein